MAQEKTGKKEIVEIKDGKVEVMPDEERTLVLTRAYDFDGEKISSLDFSRIEELSAKDLIRANNIMIREGTVAASAEVHLHYALIIASDVTGLPVEFFMQLKPKDAMKVKTLVVHHFFDGE